VFLFFEREVIKMAGHWRAGQKIWRRMKAESDREWNLFVFYRDHEGLERSVAEVADHFEVDRTEVAKIARKRLWRKRSDAWDEELDKIRLQVARNKVIKMRERQSTLGEDMQKIAEAELLKITRQVVDNPDEVIVDTKTLINLIKAGAELERINRDEPTEIVKSKSELKITWEEKPDNKN
jgi:hypothetical protein